MAKEKGLYGLMAEFTTPEALVHAAHEAHEHGYREMDAYSPMPIEELHHAMHMDDSIVPKITITGGILGCLGDYCIDHVIDGHDAENLSRFIEDRHGQQIIF